MQKKLKIKLAAGFCMVCMLLFGASVTSFATGMLSIAVSSGTVKSGDTVTVTIYAEGAEGAEVTADMNVTYDTSKLEYVSSSASNASGGGGTVKASGSSVDIKFKAVGSGDAYVKAEASTLTAAGTHITVSGSATGTTDTTDANAAKSGDNSLSSLTLSSGTLSPAFKGSVTEYSAEVGSDVNEITVTPVTSNSKATIESITGNQNLKEGTNVITVVVKAENGTTASYKITVTKGSTASGSNTGASDTGVNQPADNLPNTDTDTDTPQTSGESILIDGVTYRISEDFTDEDIPANFKRAPFEYKGDPYEGIVFEDGHLGMYYLISESGEGRFFVYDADRDKFYPYVRLSCGEHFIILMPVPNAVIPPDRYEQTTLTIGDITGIMAYQYMGAEDAEIVKTETEDGTFSEGDQSDFYIFYGMDTTGVSSWYQYDIKQGTYQRFNEEALSSGEPTEDYETLTKSYNELSDRFKTTKAKNTRLIAILIFVLVVLLIVILNLILKIREIRARDDDEDEIEEERPVRKARPKKKAAARLPKENVKKKTAPVVKEVDPDDFYDDENFMDEFEEDPGVLTRRAKKKAKPVKAQKAETHRQTVRTPKTSVPETSVTNLFSDDDDIEFLDLNDL